MVIKNRICTMCYSRVRPNPRARDFSPPIIRCKIKRPANQTLSSPCPAFTHTHPFAFECTYTYVCGYELVLHSALGLHYEISICIFGNTIHGSGSYIYIMYTPIRCTAVKQNMIICMYKITVHAILCRRVKSTHVGKYLSTRLRMCTAEL